MKTVIGLLVILLWIGFFCGAAPAATHEADFVPWSGYWWPFSKGGLVTGKDYSGRPAPMEKYDLAVHGASDGPATAFGRRYYHDPGAKHWEGMCFAWSAAAILEPEPRHGGVYNNVFFRVGDKKGILTAAYYGVLYNYYFIDDPAAFHEVLDDFIRRQGRPVIMNLGTDGEIWNYPVFKYRTNYTSEGSRRHYTTTVYYANDAVYPDYLGAMVSSSTYYYYFDVDDQGRIKGGDWEGASVGAAPVRASDPYRTTPTNPGMTYQTAVAIARTDDDAYENNDVEAAAARLDSGRHPLIAMDDDYFTVFLERHDHLQIRMETAGGSSVVWRVLNGSGRLLTENSGNGAFLITAEQDERFMLHVAPAAPENQPYYELELEQRLPYRYFFPLDNKGGWINGLALTAAPDAAAPGSGNRLVLSQRARNGRLLSATTSTIASGSKQAGSAADTLFKLSRSDNGYGSISADAPLAGMQAVMYGGDLLQGGNLIPAKAMSAVLFFPYFIKTGGWKTFIGLINAGEAAETLRLRAYDEQGRLSGEQSLVFAPGEKLEYDTAALTALAAPGARSLRVDTESGRPALVGYCLFWNPTVGALGRALVPLPLTASKVLTLPHVAQEAGWWTGLAAMNATAQSITVRLTGYDAAGDPVAAAERILNPYQQLVGLPRHFFNIPAADRIVSVRLTASLERALCGFLLFGSTDGLQLAGAALTSNNEAGPLCVPHTPSTNQWWTGLALVNTGEQEDVIVYKLYDQQGLLLKEASHALAAGARHLGLVSDIFGESADKGHYMVIESSGGQPLNGLYLLGAASGRQLMGDALIPLR